MKFHPRPISIEACQLTELTRIETVDGTTHGQCGEWLVTLADGSLHIESDSTFRQIYAPLIGSWCQACGAVSDYSDGWCEQHQPQMQVVSGPTNVSLAQRRRTAQRGG